MVSVAFAIWPFPHACDAPRRARRRAHCLCFPSGSLSLNSKRCASFPGDSTPLWLRYCMTTSDRWALQYDVDVLSDLSEPDGSDGAVAGGRLVRAQIPPSGATGH